MSHCPSLEELRQLLADELDAARRQAVEAHVETCSACQEALARLSNGGEEAQTPRLPASSSTPLPASEVDFIERLKEHPPDPEQEASRPAEESSEGANPLPQRPEEKGPLGQLGSSIMRKEMGTGSFLLGYHPRDEFDRFVPRKVLKDNTLGFCGSAQDRRDTENWK
jgi:hypothetical protein